MITLTNGAQIPENAVQLQTTAAIDGYYVTQPLRLVQYDETLPVAAVQLTYQNQPYIPPAGAELNVRMGKPDGTTVYNPCLGVDSSGIVYFAFTQQMTIVAGTGTLTVEITDSGVKNSAPIIAEIRPNPVPEGSIESADEFLTLQEILAEAEKWGQIVQTNASNIQQVVDNLEDIQNAAENAQAAAASAAAAQQAAQKALGFRTFFSAVTPDKNGNLDPSRPMTVGPAASVEIESAGDRIQSVTALGFTQQSGTGDPSPTNVRALTNGGLKLVKLVLGNGINFVLNSANTFSANLSVANSETGMQVCDEYQWSKVEGSVPKRFNIAQSVLYIVDPNYSDASSFNAYLSARYAAGNPVIVWYAPTDESDATGLYAPIILQGGEYRATCLELTAPLCEGDSVVSWVKSGCDKVVTFDGSEDEGWMDFNNGVYYVSILDSPQTKTTAYSDRYCYTGNVTVNNVGEMTWGGAAGVSNKNLIFSTGYSTLSAWKSALAAHPLTVWYRSTAYTEADDIPVSMETHVKHVFGINGTQSIASYRQAGYFTVALPKPASSNYPTIKCDKLRPAQSGAKPYCYITDGAGYLFVWPSEDMGITDAVSAKAWLAANPITVEYPIATPLVYAHPAVVLEAATGDQLTYTVTGQSGGTVSVALKPFQDGGHAKTADNATNAQNADNATEFDGHAWSEVPGQAPVQSVNGKTGAVTLSAGDVGAQPTMSKQTINATAINGATINSTTTLVQYGGLLIAFFSFIVPSGQSGWFDFAQTDLPAGTRMYAKASSVSADAPVVDFNFDGHTAQVYAGSTMAGKTYGAFVVVPL